MGAEHTRDRWRIAVFSTGSLRPYPAAVRQAFILVLLALMGCSKGPKTYESNVEVTRIDVVRRDPQGNPITTDVEVSYVECPGTQLNTIRGGREFSACMAKHKVGEKLRAKIEHARDRNGYFDHKINLLGECARPPDPLDEASFANIRDCSPMLVNGVQVGFECKYIGKKELNKVCPWFATR
jgi:hypothetical protein